MHRFYPLHQAMFHHFFQKLKGSHKPFFHNIKEIVRCLYEPSQSLAKFTYPCDESVYYVIVFKVDSI
jgi:hypothetical protein